MNSDYIKSCNLKLTVIVSACRTAAAIRTAAMSCLWALLQSTWATSGMLEAVQPNMMTQVFPLFILSSMKWSGISLS